MQKKLSSDNVPIYMFSGIAKGWETPFLLASDIHFDSPYCDRALLKRTLEKAKARNAFIMIFGDLFDLMQGKYDPRRSYDEIRPEYKTDRYIDTVVDDAIEFFQPYADQILLVSKGNHETSVLQRLNTCVISRFSKGLKTTNDIHIGGYKGWVMFRFNTGKCFQKSLFYHHGSGGGGPVTRGTIQTNRQAVYVANADIVVNGHTHDQWVLPIMKEEMSVKGTIAARKQWFIRTPGFKDEYYTHDDNWHHRTWKPPKPMGGVWGNFVYIIDRRQPDIGMEFTLE